MLFTFKILFVLLPIFYMATSLASYSYSCSNMNDIKTIISCNNFTSSSFEASPLKSCNNYNIPTGLSEKFSENGSNCTNFIKNSGELGPWGKHIKTYLTTTKNTSHFFKDDIAYIADACPNWKNLTYYQRIYFWVWTFAAIARAESSCKEKIVNKNATNGIAVGLLQLEESKSTRSWRGPHCKVASVLNAKENIYCGMDIMKELLLGKKGQYKTKGAIFINNPKIKNNSYWEKLRRPGGGIIGDLIKTNPICKVK